MFVSVQRTQPWKNGCKADDDDCLVQCTVYNVKQLLTGKHCRLLDVSSQEFDTIPRHSVTVPGSYEK